MFSVWFQCCLRGNINGWVWHACNGRKTGMSGSNSYQVVVCLQGVMRVKGERVKSEGSPSGWTNGTQETVTPRLWPLHLSRSSHSADSQLTDEGEGGRKRGCVRDRWGFPPSDPSMCIKALGHQCTNRLWHFTAHFRRLHIFMWDCFYYSHCGSLSPTLVAYAGGGSLSGSQRICSSTDGGLGGRRWGWWESIL